MDKLLERDGEDNGMEENREEKRIQCGVPSHLTKAFSQCHLNAYGDKMSTG